MSLAALTLISMGAKAQGNGGESGEMMTYTGTIRKAPRFSPKKAPHQQEQYTVLRQARRGSCEWHRNAPG